MWCITRHHAHTVRKPVNVMKTNVDKVSTCITRQREWRHKAQVQNRDPGLWCSSVTAPWPIIYCVFGFHVMKKNKVWGMLKTGFRLRTCLQKTRKFWAHGDLLNLLHFDSRNVLLVLFNFSPEDIMTWVRRGCTDVKISASANPGLSHHWNLTHCVYECESVLARMVLLEGI